MGTVNVGETIARFGRHRGLPLREIPRQYLEWVYENEIGGPDFYTAVAAFLGLWHPPTVERKHSKNRRQRVRNRQPRRNDKPHQKREPTIQSTAFNELADWPEKQEWDGETAPWLDQLNVSPLEREFREMFS